MKKGIRIGNRMVGAGHEPFIIAEMSGNHNGSLERALAIVDAAAAAGAHAVKLQTYTADTMTIPLDTGEFFISDEKSLWKGKSLYQLYEEAHTPWDWHASIFARAKEKGILCFSTPFDDTAVDFLEKLNPPCYKIASFENTDVRLIRKAASTGRPLIISTGMATEAEIGEAVDAARGAGCKELILLKCTSAYPAPPEGSNLAAIPLLRDRYGVETGLSDHTLGIGVPLAAVTLGASVIEKHFTLSRSDGGVDSAFSADPGEMKLLVEESKRAWQAVGEPLLERSAAEEKSLIFRRSIYIVKDMKKGEAFSPQNLRTIRPGFGLAVKHFDGVIGRKASRDLKRGTGLSWPDVEGS